MALRCGLAPLEQGLLARSDHLFIVKLCLSVDERSRLAHQTKVVVLNTKKKTDTVSENLALKNLRRLSILKILDKLTVTRLITVI